MAKEKKFDLIERADKIRDMANNEMEAAGVVNLAANRVTTAAVLSVIAQTIIYDAEVELERLKKQEQENEDEEASLRYSRQCESEKRRSI